MVTKAYKGPYIIAADWNKDPATLVDAGIDSMLGGRIMAPLQATMNTGSTYDFFIVSSCLEPMVVSVDVMANFVGQTTQARTVEVGWQGASILRAYAFKGSTFPQNAASAATAAVSP